MKFSLVSALALLPLVAGVTVSERAGADEPPAVSPAASFVSPAPSSAPTPQVRAVEVPAWYGWQIFLSDAATLSTTVGLLLAFRNGNGPALGVVNGTVGYELAPPFIHLMHHRPWVALGDLGLRTGAALLGGLIGVGASSCSSSSSAGDGPSVCGLAGGVVGAGLGILVAGIVDGAALAWEKETVGVIDRPARRSFSIGPELVLTRERAGLGVQGTF